MTKHAIAGHILMEATAALLCAALAMATPTHAQVAAYPNKPIKIVVPTSPGSGSDTTARHFAEALSGALAQPVLIDNKPGANGVVAAMVVKQAAADGYTIFLGTNTHMAVNPILVKDIPYDAVRDFKPLTGLARGMMMIVAAPGAKFGNVSELISAAKASRQQLNVGTYTGGFHLSAEWFGSVAGVKSVNVPYKGAPEVFAALLGDQLDWALSDLIAAIPQVRGGRLKAIAVSGDRRHPDLPEIPTVKESGFPEYVNYVWTSLYLRSETPEGVTAKLVETMQKILATQSAKDFIARIGSDPMALAPPDMRRFQLSEIERFRRIADGAGIKPQ